MADALPNNPQNQPGRSTNSVNDLISADWRSIGGLTIGGADTERYYLQTMFRANATDAVKERVRREEGNGSFGLW